MLEKFMADELPRIGEVTAAERAFELDITSLEIPFVGFIDLVAEVDGAPTVVDFETSGSAYGEHEARMSDQLVAYQLAEPNVEQAALCVFVKTKDPKIEWQVTSQTRDRLTEYLAKARLVADEIIASRFYKRTGLCCAWCDYLPVCLGDDQKVRETLVHLNSTAG